MSHVTTKRGKVYEYLSLAIFRAFSLAAKQARHAPHYNSALVEHFNPLLHNPALKQQKVFLNCDFKPHLMFLNTEE